MWVSHYSWFWHGMSVCQSFPVTLFSPPSISYLKCYECMGWVAPPKRMNFRKSSKRPLTLPPPLCNFFGKRWNKPCFKIKNLQRLLDWKWPSQSSPPPFGTFPKIHKRVTSPFPFLYSNSNSMKFFLEQNLLQKKSISFLEADSEFDEAWLLRGCAFCSKPLFWIKRIRLVCFSVIQQNFYFKIMQCMTRPKWKPLTDAALSAVEWTASRQKSVKYLAPCSCPSASLK